MNTILKKARSSIKEGDAHYWYNVSCMEAILGNTTLALDYLQKAKDANDLKADWAWDDPNLEWIRGNPRFIEIVGTKLENQ